MRSSIAWFCSVLLLAQVGWAQDQKLPESQQEQSKATTGATELTTGKTVATEKPDEAKDATELQVQAGGLSSEGNARAVALTGGSKFRLRREDNQFKAAVAGNYAATSVPSPQPREYSASVQNFQGLARYDRFVQDFILFLQLQARNDRFAGYDIRGQVDPGVGYAIINEKTMQLTVELGYDLMYQRNRTDARFLLDDSKNVILGPSGLPSLDPAKPKSYTIHSGRAAVTYEFAFNKTSKLTSALEFLQGINDTEFYRLNFDAALTAKLVGSLSISVGESIRFDNSAAKLGKAKTDYLSSGNLVYTLM